MKIYLRRSTILLTINTAALLALMYGVGSLSDTFSLSHTIILVSIFISELSSHALGREEALEEIGGENNYK